MNNSLSFPTDLLKRIQVLRLQVTVWAQRKDSCYRIKPAVLNTSDAFQSLFAQHTGTDSLPC